MISVLRDSISARIISQFVSNGRIGERARIRGQDEDVLDGAMETPFINYIVDVRDSSRSLKAYIRGCSWLQEEKYANDTARERVLNAARVRRASPCVFVIPPDTTSDSRALRMRPSQE